MKMITTAGKHLTRLASLRGGSLAATVFKRFKIVVKLGNNSTNK